MTDIPATQWRSYLNTADHPEYPSGSASFCAAHAQAARRYFGSDVFGWTVEVPKGSSWVEPGITPAEDVVLGWPTWTDFEQECGMSRLWGGVHFLSSLSAGRDIGRPIGDLAYEFVSAHLSGKPPASSRWSFDLSRFDLSRFDRSRFDLSRFDFSRFALEKPVED